MTSFSFIYPFFIMLLQYFYLVGFINLPEFQRFLETFGKVFSLLNSSSALRMRMRFNPF